MKNLHLGFLFFFLCVALLLLDPGIPGHRQPRRPGRPNILRRTYRCDVCGQRDIGLWATSDGPLLCNDCDSDKHKNACTTDTCPRCGEEYPWDEGGQVEVPTEGPQANIEYWCVDCFVEVARLGEDNDTDQDGFHETGDDNNSNTDGGDADNYVPEWHHEREYDERAKARCRWCGKWSPAAFAAGFCGQVCEADMASWTKREDDGW